MSTVTVSIQDEFIKKIDVIVHQRHWNRSKFIQESIKQYIQSIETNKLPRRKNPQILKAIEVQDRISQKDSLPHWDSTQEIRKWRDSRR
jgi:metal-responsive CopG/Arc/MetJ family transcriptional regulator